MFFSQILKTIFVTIDLQAIYKSSHPDPTIGPKELQNKVQWDIMYYFARQGAENMYHMTKSTFKYVTDDDSGLNYITRAEDEETKNHIETDLDIISGHMPELPNCKYCPVQSYFTYLYSLSLKSEFLWQQANRNSFPADGKGIWYGPVRVGHNKIDSFVTNISKLCDLQHKEYSNHSLKSYSHLISHLPEFQ